MPSSRAASIELSPRLRAIAEKVTEGQPVADIGSDHARLPAALVASGRCPRAIATDRNPGPLAQARATISALGLSKRIELRLGDGVSVLEAMECDGEPSSLRLGSIVIAGMGARTIRRILSGLRFGGRLVLQPNGGFPHVGELRRFLHGAGWTLIDEDIVEDREHLYVIMVAVEAVGHRDQRRDARDMELGPILRAGDPPHPLFRRWIEVERERNERACLGLEHGRGDHAAALELRRRWAEMLDATGSSPADPQSPHGN
jgi:tRNA (adenine22-N1)-methyltransferase